MSPREAGPAGAWGWAQGLTREARHLCGVYGEEGALSLVVPWLAQGLGRGEMAVYVADGASCEEVAVGLGGEGVDPWSCARSGQLVLVGQDQAFPQGVLGPQGLGAVLEELARRARAGGFSWVRVAGEMSWVLGSDPPVGALTTCEASLERFCQTHQALVLCLYHGLRLPPALLVVALATHPLVLAGGEVVALPGFVPAEDLDPARWELSRLRRWVDRLREQGLEQRRSREALHRYQFVFESSSEGILIVDGATGEVVEANPGAMSILGRADVAGRPVWCCLPHLCADAGAWEKLLRTLPHVSGFGLQRPDGAHVDLEVRVASFPAREGRLVQCALRDVTERVRALRHAEAASEEALAHLRKAQRSTKALLSVVEDQKRTELELRKTLREREVLLQEVHHRVKNSLQAIISLAELRRERLADEAARAALQDVAEQARTMALAYEQLYHGGGLAQIAMGPYLRALCAHVLQAFGHDKFVEVHVDADLALPVDRATPCGLAVTELVTNALKHAFPTGRGTVWVRLWSEGDVVRLTVRDDGCGLPDGAQERGYGLRLVALWITHQLGGDLRLSGEGGTLVEATFPMG